MSAEHASLLDEAQGIVGTLLPIQRELNERANESAQHALASVQSQETIDPVTASDLFDSRIVSTEPVLWPALLDRALPLSSRSAATTEAGRLMAERIIFGEDRRLLVLTGPCSIHNVEEAIEYAQQVTRWRKEFGGLLEIIMRFYTEKPRTTIGWKGLSYDPHADDSYDINLGLTLSRMGAQQITAMGVPLGMERLNDETPQYYNGLITYDALGARNVTVQTSWEYGSTTSSVIGIKNGIDGSMQEVCNAVKAVKHAHTYLGRNMEGALSRIKSKGNDTAHIILRGSRAGPNYSPAQIEEARAMLLENTLLDCLVVDASHGNSQKKHRNQRVVVESLAAQIADGNLAIRGVMLESNLREGNQDINEKPHKYGTSVTDECIGIEETHELLEKIAEAAQKRYERAA